MRLLISLMPLGALLYFALLRAGFEHSVGWGEAAMAIGITWLVLFLPPLLANGIDRRVGQPDSSGVWMVLILLALALNGVLSFGPNLGWAAAVAGVVTAISWAWICVRQKRFRPGWILLSPLGLLFGAALAGIVWSMTLHEPLILPGLALGLVHIDTLFHSSIVSMIQTYGIPSTGVEGLPLVRYHFGSHAVIGGLASLLSISPLDTYAVIYPTVAPAWFVSAIHLAVRQLGKLNHREIPIARGLVLLFLLFVAVAGLLPREMAQKLMFYHQFLISESQNLGLTLAIAAVAGGIGIFGSQTSAPRWALVGLLYAPAIIALATVFKISIGAVGLATWLYLLLRLDRLTLMWRLAMGAAALAAFWAVAPMVRSPSGMAGGGYEPLSFLRHYIPVWWWPYFVPLYYFWPLLFLVLAIRARNAQTAMDLVRLLRARRLLAAEVTAVAMIVALMPAMLLRIAGGSALFFSDVAAWIGLLLLLSAVVRYGWLVPEFRLAEGGGGVRLNSVLLSAVFLVLGAQALGRVTDHVTEAFRRNVALRLKALDYEIPPDADRAMTMASAGEVGWGRLFGSEPYEAWRASERGRALLELADFRTYNRSQRAGMIMFIPQDSDVPWQLEMQPFARPFVAPALTGIPLIGGRPEKRVYGYGYGNYDWHVPPVKSASEAEAAAAAMGFQQLVIWHD